MLTEIITVDQLLEREFPIYREQNWIVENKYTRSHLATIDVGGTAIPLATELFSADDWKYKVLNPFYPELGYDITSEDFDPIARAKKLLSGMPEYTQEIGKAQGMFRFRIHSIALVDEQRVNYLRNTVFPLISTPYGDYLGYFSDERSVIPLGCDRFIPIDLDFQSIASPAEDIVDLELPFRERMRLLGYLVNATPTFILHLPNDTSSLSQVRLRFKHI